MAADIHARRVFQHEHNIRKQRSSSSFTPSFNNKNQISNNNGFAPSYDANGNLSDDPVNAVHNVYSWDAEGKLLSANGASAIYDALGRVVELSPSAGIYSEVLYGLTGTKLASMSGTTPTQAWIPLPGGGTAVYNSSGMQYYEHPRLAWKRAPGHDSRPSRTF